MTLVDQNRVSAAVQRTRLLADWLRGYIGLLPTWRADYFERGAQTQRSAFIVAKNIAFVLEEVCANLRPSKSNKTRPRIRPRSSKVQPKFFLQSGGWYESV
jgi:hypothetical protein